MILCFFCFFGKSACCPERLTVCNAVKTCFRWLPEGHCMPVCVTNKGWRTKTPNTNCCTCSAGAASNFWSYVQSRFPLCTQHHIADSHSSLADMPHSPIFSRHSAKRSQFGRFLVGGKLFQSHPPTYIHHDECTLLNSIVTPGPARACSQSSYQQWYSHHFHPSLGDGNPPLSLLMTLVYFHPL